MILFVIPVTALILALGWVRWARRPEKPMDPLRQVEAYRRSMLALARHHRPAIDRPRQLDTAD